MFEINRISRNSCWLILACGLTLLAIFSPNNNMALAEDDIPMSKLSQNVGAPTIKFLYCYSCGYRKMYDQYEQIINQKYPYMLVDGSNFEPPGMYMFIVKLLGILKILVIICILSGVNIFEYINQPRPNWWLWCLENKLYACMMIYFVSNLIEGQLIQSGAFEIFLNNVPIWSKLESGRIPQPAELFNIIDSNMQFANTKLGEYAK